METVLKPRPFAKFVTTYPSRERPTWTPDQGASALGELTVHIVDSAPTKGHPQQAYNAVIG